MPFPVTQRVVYKNNPLDNVICQLRFPTILEIDSKLPSEFQNMIRSNYPILNEKKQLSANLPPELMQLLETNQPLGATIAGKPLYEFASRENDWIVELTSNSIALTAKKYRRWEEFKDHLEGPFDALNKIYKPAFFQRIGLRYINVILRSKLGLPDEVTWSELLASHIVGSLAKESVGGHVREYVSTTLIDLTDELGQVRLATGLGKHQETGEQGFVIDNDFFTDKETEVKDVFDTLGQFNKRSGRAFNWAISDKLRNALEPEPITE